METLDQNYEPAKVSVIIPVYNCKDYISHCLQSVCDQSYKNLEIIVVDDGSDDGSSEIIDRFADSDGRIDAVHEKNCGVSNARNTAIGKATGKYLVFVDADDYIGTDYIAGLVSAAETNNSDMCFTGFTVYENGKMITETVPDSYKREADEIWAYRISMTACRLYLLSYWKQKGLHFIDEPGARAEDVPVALYANATAGNIVCVSRADYFIVRRKGSATNSGERVLFGFPYKAFSDCYRKVICENEITNSRRAFLIGVVKSLAQFEYMIFRKADKGTKQEFSEYVGQLLEDNTSEIRQAWKECRHTISLPFTHRMAISMFVKKYC